MSAVLVEGSFGEFCEDVVDPRQTGEPSGYLAIHELAVIGPLVASAVAPTSGTAAPAAAGLSVTRFGAPGAAPEIGRRGPGACSKAECAAARLGQG